MLFELRKKRSDFRQHIRRKQINQALKSRRSLTISSTQPLLSLLQSLPNPHSLLKLQNLIDISNPFSQQVSLTLLSHLPSIGLGLQKFVLTLSSQQPPHQFTLRVKSFVKIFAHLLARYPQEVQQILGMFSDDFVDLLCEVGLQYLAYHVYRQVDVGSLGDRDIANLRELLRNRSVMAEEEIYFLLDVLKYEECTRKTELVSMYFNEYTLTSFVASMTSPEYSEYSFLGSAFLNLLQQLVYLSDSYSQTLVDCGLLNKLHFYLQFGTQPELISCLRLLYNLCIVKELRKKVREAGLFGLVASKLDKRDAVVFVCGYYSMMQTPEEIQHFQENQGIKLLVQILSREDLVRDQELKGYAAMAVEHIIGIGDQIQRDEELNANPYLRAFESLGGILCLQALDIEIDLPSMQPPIN